jgi:hypothetical protein
MLNAGAAGDLGSVMLRPYRRRQRAAIPGIPKKGRNLDCHPGVSAGILGFDPARSGWTRPRAIREVAQACTRIKLRARIFML